MDQLTLKYRTLYLEQLLNNSIDNNMDLINTNVLNIYNVTKLDLTYILIELLIIIEDIGLIVTDLDYIESTLSLELNLN